MRAVDIIRKKRDGEALDRTEIDAFVEGVTTRGWPDYQTAAMLMAIVLRGMNAEETAWLTGAMTRSGAQLDLSDIPGPKIDKHSTGGVGDKTSLVLAPLAAAGGVIVPMMSGRGLGHSGGTLDKLEAIPGYRVSLTVPEFRAVLRRVGCSLIGQTTEIAPADRILYALRDVTATIESIPLITGSIMSKKLAEGIQGLVMDVKCGRGAFMKTPGDARVLADALCQAGEANQIRVAALITAMNAPVGRAVGHALEVIESCETLKGRGPADGEFLAVRLAAEMLHIGGAVAGTPRDLAASEAKVRAVLTAGTGLDKLREMIAAHGGEPRVIDDYRFLPTAPDQTLVRANRSGYVTAVDAERVGRAVMLLGAGRDRVDDPIDHAVGVVVRATVGEAIKANEPLLEVHHRGTQRLGVALDLLESACTIADAPAPKETIILDERKGFSS